jgi:MAE_28990/MAE_18760-like HEPN
MKIRNFEQLSLSLDNDLVWRKKEISNLKSLIETRSFSESKHNVLLRSGITILYAHWEGFVKIASTNYLNFVANQKLSYNDLAINFLAVAMKEKLNQASETKKASVFTDVAKFILEQGAERSTIPYEGIFSTASNLSSEVLKEITCMLGLDFEYYQSRQIILDERLLKRRNMIAHGEQLQRLELEDIDYDDLHKSILNMMEFFRNQIENSAIQKLYLRVNCKS